VLLVATYNKIQKERTRIKKRLLKAHACNTSIQETEAGGSLSSRRTWTTWQNPVSQQGRKEGSEGGRKGRRTVQKLFSRI
jgi:hypothetical protein